LFIHLGENVIVRSTDVIAILDKQLMKSSSIVTEFLEKQNKQVVELTIGETKSIVVTINQIYFSPLSSNTLKKRAQHISDLETTYEEEYTS
jgi:extracellular matrix regulatory protein B